MLLPSFVWPYFLRHWVHMGYAIHAGHPHGGVLSILASGTDSANVTQADTAKYDVYTEQHHAAKGKIDTNSLRGMRLDHGAYLQDQ